LFWNLFSGPYLVYVGVGLWTEHLFSKFVCVCCDWAVDRSFVFSLCMLGLGRPVEMQMCHLDYAFFPDPELHNVSVH